MLNVRRKVAAALVAVGIAAGAGAVAAPSAQAAIRPGNYTYSVWDGPTRILTQPAVVRGNRIYLVHEQTWYEIKPTRSGGVVTAEMIDRRVFWRSGDGYAGVSYMWFIPRHKTVTARLTLTPTR
ncbi:hypothetical protein [Gordonia crocea]|uniref:Secreted protein n=1 Tax=Gordonia crocea TaxID=589162 RepID=A0A7I9V0P7_9ACTN|nr:hypothetical protein [Gordonia crocea]GED98701.1 hypothetical protein nbrc107697_27400 [Gordonia crocea]